MTAPTQALILLASTIWGCATAPAAPKGNPEPGLSSRSRSWSVCGNVSGTEQRIEDCKRIEGSSRATSKGIEFKLVASTGPDEQVWKDVATGVVWHEALPGTFTWQEAKEACARQGLELPAIEQFLRAESDGFSEVGPNLAGFWFWSRSSNFFLSSSYSGPPHGYVVNLYPKDRVSVRCVEQHDPG